MRNEGRHHGGHHSGRVHLDDEVTRIGRLALAGWRSQCDWCRSSSACRGDPYVCAYVTAEVEPELQRR